jgi:hypothetical protein
MACNEARADFARGWASVSHEFAYVGSSYQTAVGATRPARPALVAAPFSIIPGFPLVSRFTRERRMWG